MRISLVVPNAPRHIHRETFEPIGILYVAAGVCEEHTVQVVDAFNRQLTLEQTVKEILHFQPDVVGVSITMSPTAPFGKALAQELKKSIDVRVVVGGTHATFAAGELATNPYIDIVVLHEGEQAFQEIIRSLERKSGLCDIKGILFQHNHKLIKTTKREPISDLDQLPFPARHLIPDQAVYQRRHILSSRGCPFKCVYCASSAMNQYRWRPRSPRNVLKEIEVMVSNYSETFYFADDNFPVSKERTYGICEKIIEQRLQVSWACLSRVEFLKDSALLNMMARSGCREIFVGVESGSDDVLRKMNRNYTAEDVKRVVNLCNQTGISTTLSFLLGNPYEQLEDVKKTFELATDVDTPNVAFHILTPYIGTQVFTRPGEFGLTMLSDDPEQFDKNKEPVMETRYLSAKQVMELYCESFGISLKKARQRWWRG